MKMKICSVLLAVCMLFCLFGTLSSCFLWGEDPKTEIPDIVNTEINENGELVLFFSDGTEKNLGVVVGKDGEDGQNGANGAKGDKGEAGTTTVVSDGSSIPTASAKGLRSAVSIVCNFQETVASLWPGGSTVKDYSASGSGVLYRMSKDTGDAFIITNYHVVYDANSNTENGISDDINVYLYGSEIADKAMKASYVGGSLFYDIAVLRVEDSAVLKNSDACEIDIADSDAVAVGDNAIAIGNAQGNGVSVSVGVVSVDSEYITMTAADGRTEVSFRVMRVDTAVNSGNSGGGLYDDTGELIGIVNAKIIDDTVENIGYAIPSNVAIAIAENIIDYCYGTDTETVQRALLGITVTTSGSKAVYNRETGKMVIEETVLVQKIEAGSLAAGALQVGDVLVSATLGEKTKPITRQYQMIDMMLDARAGDVLTLTVLRGGASVPLNVVITSGCIVSY